MSIHLSFLGASGNVTGSCYRVETDQSSVLVDCGMFQERVFQHRNWESFPFDPASLSAVVLTHAHLDHVGRIPRLMRQGFRGPIYGTKATLAIAGIVLLDAGFLQEEDARQKRKRHERDGVTGKRTPEPLFDRQDAEDCLTQMRPIPFDEDIEIAPGIQVRMTEAGHILGAASIRMQVHDADDQKSILFSGDIGRWEAPILRDPRIDEEPADVVLIESTYGDRTHEATEDIPQRLEQVIQETADAGGNIIIPTFAVERAQDILYHLSYLLKEKRIPPLLVFLDSPMALKVTEVFRRSFELMDDETLDRKAEGIRPWDFSGLKTCRTREQSKSINQIRGTAIILAGSGMCTGGRIKHHLIRNIGREESTILFVGYQAEGTLGRYILEGNSDVRILGRNHEVRARIERIEGFSGHADRTELMRWLRQVPSAPEKTFVIHGEKMAARDFKDHIESELGWPEVTVPHYRDQFPLPPPFRKVRKRGR